MQMKKSERVFGSTKRKRKILGIYDIEIKDVEGVEIDVSRTKIIGLSSIKIRTEILNSILQGFKELGYFQKLTNYSQKLLKNKFSLPDEIEISEDFKNKFPPTLLAKIQQEFPKLHGKPFEIIYQLSTILNEPLGRIKSCYYYMRNQGLLTTVANPNDQQSTIEFPTSSEEI